MTNKLARGALDRSMVRAVAWNAAAKWLTQILTWLATIIVARLLTPADYGLVGMAGLYLTLATMVSQIGIADAVIAMTGLTRRQLSELNTVAMLVGIALVGLSCAVARPLAHFFASPALESVVLVVSIVYVANGLQVVPRALMQRELRFKALAGIEMARALAQMVVTLVLAVLGFGYWSLVLGTVASAFLGTGLTLCFRQHPFAFPRFSQLRKELSFSANVMVSGATWYVYSNSDFLVAGRVLGQVPLGFYTLAWTISSAPIEKVGNLLLSVTPAFFSAVQHDKAELRRYLSRLTEMLAYVTVPLSFGIIVLADVLVPVVLGPKWAGVVGPLRLLGLLTAFRSIAILPGRVLNVTGDTSFTMWSSIATAAVLPFAFLLGSRWGTNGIATAWILAYPPLMVPIFYRTFQRIEMKALEYLASLMPSLGASLAMACAILAIRAVLGRGHSPLLSLGVSGITGALFYGGTLWMFHRERVLGLWRAILRARRSAPEAVAPPASINLQGSNPGQMPQQL
jgi:PST family polysaccharide transporter